MTIFDMIPMEEKKSMTRKLPPVDEYDKETILQMEKEVLGIYISGHPLDDVKDIWKRNVSATAFDFSYQEDQEGSIVKDKQQVKIGGIIESINQRLTKKKETMAILEVEDLTGAIEVMVFPKAFERLKGQIKPDSLVFISGHVTTEDEADSKLIAEDIVGFDEVPKTLWLKFDDMEMYDKYYGQVEDTLKKHKGVDIVKIRVIKEDKLKVLPKYMNVYADEELVAQIEQILGKGSAVVR